MFTVGVQILKKALEDSCQLNHWL